MKRFNLWMLAAILTISGAMTTLTSCSTDDNIVYGGDETKSAEHKKFDQQMSMMLDEAVKMQNLQPTMHAAEVLTGFIEQLKMEALAPQFQNIMLSLLGSVQPLKFEELGDKSAEARNALNNTFSAMADATSFVLVDAQKALGGMSMTFTEGEKEMKYETGKGENLIIAYTNPTTKEGTEVSFGFANAEEGVTMFVTRMANSYPVAIQFPGSITFSIKHTHAGETQEVMNGTVFLTSIDGKKYISLKGSAWQISGATNSELKDRFEVPVFNVKHNTDGTVEGMASLFINSTSVLKLEITNSTETYSDAEMETIHTDLREKGRFFSGFYDLLKTFNSRSGKAKLTVMDDLVADVDVKDVALGVSTLADVVKMRETNPTQADIDPLTEKLNQAISFNVIQNSTGIKGEGKLVTALIDGKYYPAIALRFEGEKDFTVMYNALSEKDRNNYESLLKSFDAPFRQLDKLFQAFDQKRKDFENVNPFKGLM